MAIPEDSNSQTFLKFLIPNKAAGLIIGKSGASIVELQQATGAVIKVNNAAAGVTERVLIVAGPAESVNSALEKVLFALRDAEIDPNATSAPVDEISVKLLIPPASAPVIIGHGGATIKDLHASTGTTVKIGNRQVLPNGRRPSLTDEEDRQMTVSGPLAKVQMSIASILSHISKFSKYETEGGLRETLSRTTRQASAAAAPEYPAALYAMHTQLEFYVANEEAGAIIGRSGRRIKELSHKVHASVSRHDEVDTENRRKVSLAGPVQQVHRAHLEVLNWLREHREAAANGTAGTTPNNGTASNSNSGGQRQPNPQATLLPGQQGQMNFGAPLSMVHGGFPIPNAAVHGGMAYGGQM